MSLPVLTLENVTKKISLGNNETRTLLDQIHLTIHEGDFITVLGGNGAGKSTLFNSIAGTLSISNGKILLKDQNITAEKEEKRAQYFSRVFQDPKMGTAPRMTVAENLLLAMHRGQKRRFITRKLVEHQQEFFELCQLVGNGLEKHLDTPTGDLSGGQRQALSLLMATLTKPDLLLLDEHTAALDPKTSKQLMQLTQERIEEKQLTCLMITHQMEDALRYGNRLILLKDGRIQLDLDQSEKEKLTMQDLFGFFEQGEKYHNYSNVD